MNRSRTAWLLGVLCLLLAAASLAIPLYIIRPFVPQTPGALDFALRVRFAAPWIAGICLVVVVLAVVRAWGALAMLSRVGLFVLTLLVLAVAVGTRVNIFEKMFKPYGTPQFVAASEANVDPDDKVLAFTADGEAKAYPVRYLGYHHIVNDTVGHEQIAVTYCTLCHTGLVWKRAIANGPNFEKLAFLTFRLAGINNGNALLRDEQTNSIWQQSTGEAIYGFFKGRHLTNLGAQELTFATWKAEHPNGLVLKPNAAYQAEYDPKDWETRILRHPVVVDVSRSGIDGHTLMLGVHVDDAAKAYPLQQLLDAGIVQDRVAGTSLLLVTGRDGASVRVFDATLPGEHEPLTFVRSGAADAAWMTDTESSSTWSFQGCAVAGKFAGKCLTPVESHKTFWFDWWNHNPATERMR